MDSIKKTYTSFPFEWSVKSYSYKIRYRKAFDINMIDETFCSIINAKENKIEFSELCYLLGFNLQDLAETDILNIYLKGLTEYNLIEIDKEVIQLTDFGQEALKSKLKYKYYFAATELLENRTATGESIDFSFKSLFDIENSLFHEREITKEIFDNPQLKQKLQLQLFGSDIYKGEIIELYQTDQYISYKSISLECELFEIDNSFQLTIYKGGVNKPDIQFLIDLPENEELKRKLIRTGMYHHILLDNNSINVKDIETYIDLWNWKELAENPKTDWNDKNTFKLFLENGDGNVWSSISEKAPVECIKLVINQYAEYWNWSKLTERFDDNFINEHIENYNWDFEELSYKETKFVMSLLSKPALTDCDWDWNYLSKNLPDKFIEEHIEDFAWDFYVITVSKKEVFKNIFIKYRNKLDTLISKNWNWQFISEEINLNYLHKNISAFASKLDWHIVLNRFFKNAEISAKCLREESFKSLLKQYLPANFVVAHQKYLWTTSLIDFFEQQNLIQWQSKAYINGFDTNENVEWDNTSFEKYHNRITTEIGFLNVSKLISDYSLIEEFPDFAWNWEGVSKNKNLINNLAFIEKAFIGEFSFSNNLLWAEILSQSTFDVSFWNKNLEAYNNVTNNEKQSQFWVSITQKEKQEYIFANIHFPWDWTFITDNSTEETILDSFDDKNLLEKWDWKVATRKLDKETILDNLDVLSEFIDWRYTINELFCDEFVFENPKLNIAYRLSQLEPEKQKNIWELLTTKYPFEKIFGLVEKTFEFDAWKWDWDFIVNQNLLPTDINTLNKFKNKINWSIFSESNEIQKKFNPKINWKSYKEWENNTDKYLSKFADNWDWKVLSKNEYIASNLFIITKHKGEKWDWEYLSEFGGFLTKPDKDKRKYLVEKVVKQFHDYIKFEFLSKRKDIAINSDLILSTNDKNWDWQILSENNKAEISNELIIELKNKNWNWKAISQRKKIDFTNKTFLQLLDKDWDWNYLSDDPNLEFNAEFIENTKSKPWNWKNVSRHKSFLPTIELLSLTKDFDLDWEYLSKHFGLNPTKELLAKFENKWYWHSITENPQIDYTDIAFIERFADKWNWRFICESGKLPLNSQVLNQFKEHLEWNLISSNNNIDFTVEIIQKFKPFWNWTALKNNKRVEELLGNYVKNEINNSSTLNFIDRIEQQWSKWKGSIYHYSHIDNAVEIIKSRKIQSRNKANIKGDAAGNVVHLRNDAHDYARFYFRPHTPTQFYNEFLGKNTSDGYDSKNNSWVSWYEKARGLGFPKCPIPIFFRFSLQDVLFKDKVQCCISNGNMQTGSTQFGNIEKMINKFGFEDLYYTPQQYATKEDYNRYRNYAQQEFLVKDELSFNDLRDFEIVCPSESDRALLINLLGREHEDIFTNIVVDTSYYNNENPRVRIEQEEAQLHISTSLKGSGYFVLNGTSELKEIEILSGDINKIDSDKIVFNSYVSLGKINQNVRLNFIDESGRSWFVYSNGKIEPINSYLNLSESWREVVKDLNFNPIIAINLLKECGFSDVYSFKIRHYKLEFHTLIVCQNFENYFVSTYTESLSKELFRTLLILHDIGKTKAFIEGDKNRQYYHTEQIIKNIWKDLGYSKEELSIILALLADDILGKYFQSNLSNKETIIKLSCLASSCSLPITSFFRLFMIYYQCDVASYTADAGGIRFLEHLFDYNNGEKVFDNEDGLLKMSPKYWEMYKQLKSEIKNGD